MNRRIAENSTRREFLKQAAVGGAVALMSPASRVLGANDRVRVGMIGAGARGQELAASGARLPNAQVVAIADAYSRRRQEARLSCRTSKHWTTIAACWSATISTA